MKIHLTGAHADKFALVDADAPALVFEANWSLSTNGYAKTNRPQGNGRFTSVPMHRVVMGAQPGQIIDHINRNRLDNRRENLRFVTSSQNARNTERASSRHGYKGVSQQPASLGYVAEISFNGRTYYLGTYPTPESAALAYNDKALEIDGKFAILNDVDESFRMPRTTELRNSGILVAGKPRSSTGLWGVMEQPNGKFSAKYRGKYLGIFEEMEEAGAAYDVEAKKEGYYRINFPE